MNSGRQVDMSTDERVWTTHNPGLCYFCPGPVNPDRQVDRWTINVLTGSEVNIREQGIMGNPYLSTCRLVNLSTCLPGLTGPEVDNKRVDRI